MIARLIVSGSMLLLASSAQAQDGNTLIAQGRMAFRDQGCYGCHTAEKMGTPIGPDLSRIGAKRDQAELARRLRTAGAHMPKLQLTEAEVQGLAAYLGSLR
ncbi:MAG TPA: c-type cytochrome [Methylomirabilota bacterium]|nr:c-type cytochrome [Methylomirabilota bacterium]